MLDKRTCLGILEEIERIMKTIASLEDRPEALLAARALARRALQMLKKVADLDIRTARALENNLRLLQDAQVHRMLRPQVLSTGGLVEYLKGQCAGRLQRKEETMRRMMFERGELLTYGRMMLTSEYNRLRQVMQLEAADPAQQIPAFLAPPGLMERLNKIDAVAIHNLYAQMGGTGNVEVVVCFQTDIRPVTAGHLRRAQDIIEVKFPHGTPISRIVYTRRV